MQKMNKTDITEGLSRLLASTYSLYLKTQNFHWHVTGPLFHSLHRMFEEQYNELAEAVDRLAERIRSLGAAAPATFSQFLKLSSVHEEEGIPTSLDMVHKLLADHEKVISELEALMPVAQKHSDEATLDLLIQRTETHQKTAWMLRSSCEPQLKHP